MKASTQKAAASLLIVCSFLISAPPLTVHADEAARPSLFDSKFQFKKKPSSSGGSIYQKKMDAFKKRNEKQDSIKSTCETQAKSSSELLRCRFSEGHTKSSTTTSTPKSSSPTQVNPKQESLGTTTTTPASQPAAVNSDDSLDKKLDSMIDNIYSDAFSKPDEKETPPQKATTKSTD